MIHTLGTAGCEGVREGEREGFQFPASQSYLKQRTWHLTFGQVTLKGWGSGFVTWFLIPGLSFLYFLYPHYPILSCFILLTLFVYLLFSISGP